jgi:hypothetical protein
MAMYVKVYDNKRTKSYVWADFGLKRMKLDGGIEQEMAITHYVSNSIFFKHVLVGY